MEYKRKLEISPNLKRVKKRKYNPFIDKEHTGGRMRNYERNKSNSVSRRNRFKNILH
jgi:hypothetical protein